MHIAYNKPGEFYRCGAGGCCGRGRWFARHRTDNVENFGFTKTGRYDRKIFDIKNPAHAGFFITFADGQFLIVVLLVYIDYIFVQNLCLSLLYLH